MDVIVRDQPPEAAKVFAEHYQKTFELTYEHWQQRNRLFVALLLTIGGGTLVASDETVRHLFLDWLAGQINTDPAALYTSFPFDLAQAILTSVVFYLMFNLYHRALSVLRNYQYLDAVEGDIRRQMALDAAAVIFTREGKFYWQSRTLFSGLAKWVYVILLLILLTAFFVLNLPPLAFDSIRSILMSLIKLAGLVMTAIYYLGFVLSSFNLDRRIAGTGR